MRIWIRNTAFVLANLCICDLWIRTQRKSANLQFAGWHTSEMCRFWDLRTTQNKFVCPPLHKSEKSFCICMPLVPLSLHYYKFVDLQFADWHTSEICRFEICGLTKEICVTTFAKKWKLFCICLPLVPLSLLPFLCLLIRFLLSSFLRLVNLYNCRFRSWKYLKM